LRGVKRCAVARVDFDARNLHVRSIAHAV